MIDANVAPSKTSFVAALAAKAAVLAQAYGENLVRARANDPTRWQLARLVWPLFAKGR
ncbi:MAG TPA: hypothetical protein VF418_00800 [Sphingomonadaceae bacterium]